jgi:excisionase family DNA binding protein
MSVSAMPEVPYECVVFDRHDTARYLRLGLSTVAELTARRELRSIKVGRRRLYRKADLDAWLAGKVEC